MAIPTISIL